jgi:hypothetical protein
LCDQKAKSLCLSCFSVSGQGKNAPKWRSVGDELVTSFATEIGRGNRDRKRRHLLPEAEKENLSSWFVWFFLCRGSNPGVGDSDAPGIGRFWAIFDTARFG